MLAERYSLGPWASKLARKLTFVCSWVFGRVGQALLKPLHRRQRSSSSAEVELHPALKASFRLLVELLPSLKPRLLPSFSRSVNMRIASLYADASSPCIAIGDVPTGGWMKARPCHSCVRPPTDGAPSTSARQFNDGAFVRKCRKAYSDIVVRPKITSTGSRQSLR